MSRPHVLSAKFRRMAPLVRMGCVVAGMAWLLHAPAALAADTPDLPAVKPIVTCEQLAKVDLGKTAGTEVTFTATVLQTPKGAFCKVAGDVEPGNGFEIDLPIEHWTQRYVQSAQGNIAVNNAGSCAPATNGEMVVGVNSRGGSRRREGWQTDPAKRIAFAYELNHQTALMAKALIKAFYGQAQRFSYLTGCSGGGREVLIEGQRYPDDFDGIASGAPAILLSIHNGGFYHGWEPVVNRRADGSAILTRDQLPVLHAAAIAHCAAASDAMDGILQMPTACTFDPAWVRCAPGAADPARCLSAEQAAVAQKLYEGARDESGRGFDMGGFPLGSELIWPLTAPGRTPPSRTGEELRYLLPLPEADQSPAALDAAFRFDQPWFDKIRILAPLYNGADTDLRRFQAHGGKLLLWQGAEDATVQQQSTIAYYQGVQKALGEQATDGFLRFFLLPGVAHCGGGDGPAQIDVLSPLMAWVEQQRRPELLVAGKTATQRSAIPGEGPAGGGNAGPRYPYAASAQPALLTRPVYPFPNVARYGGTGDRNDPASYRPVRSPVRVPQALNSRAEQLIGPDNHAFYRVVDGRLVGRQVSAGWILPAIVAAAAWLTHAPAARAADALDLPVVKPVVVCEQLAKVDLGRTAGTAVTFTATVTPTAKGAFCKVAGDVEPGNQFEVDLPIEHWTQRYVQSAQGNIAVNNAGSCAPATGGEMVVGVNSRTGSRARENWQADARQRLAFAYLLNHQTALIAKHLIMTFYGQAQRFAYFTGCSGGGREVLIEVQRFPDDFDGVTVGAPNILLSVHNGGFFHGWQAHVNERADGSLVLSRDRLGILHDAVIAHCAAASDAMDGVLQMPTACAFDPAWVRCAPGTADAGGCLRADEVAVAQQLYDGARDEGGRGFDTAGYPLGSELFWPLGLRAGGAGDNTGDELRYLLPLSDAGQSAATLAAAFRFDQAWYDRVTVLAPLYNGADTDLRRFQAHGGKLLLWQGAADPVVQQQTTIAYYQGVQKVLGEQATDGFLRFFLLPGVAHCGGGDGPAQIDVLSPLIAWVEQQRRPELLIAGKPANQRSAVPGQGGGGGASGRPRYPYAAAAQPAVLTRPVFPFPNVARYDGSGDRNDPASYRPVRSSVPVPQVLNSRAAALIGPDNHAFYRVENGQLVAEKVRTASE